MDNLPWLKDERKRNNYIETIKDLYSLRKERLEGYIYVISCSKYHKIGRTRDINKRVYQISTSNPHKVRLVTSVWVKNSVGLENILHSAFGSYRKQGEWFRLSPEMVELIDEILKKING